MKSPKPATKRPAKAAKKVAAPHSSPTTHHAFGRNVRKELTGTAKLLSSEVGFRGRVFHITTDTVIEPGGFTGTRDVIQHSGSVVILAVDSSMNPADPSILMERQYRHAAGKFLLELPAGRIEPGESALAAAKRELIEETGFRARRWSRHVRYYASPGFLAETMQVFLAEDIIEGPAQPEEDEKIQILHIPLSGLLAMVQAGKIEDGKTMLSVLLYASRRRAQNRFFSSE